jgi:hypothetical protein
VGEERLGPLEPFGGQEDVLAPAVHCLAPAPDADPVADVVAEDRRDERDGRDPEDVEPPGAGVDGRGHHDRLAGSRHAEALHSDHGADGGVAPAVQERSDPVQEFG